MSWHFRPIGVFKNFLMSVCRTVRVVQILQKCVIYYALSEAVMYFFLHKK